MDVSSASTSIPPTYTPDLDNVHISNTSTNPDSSEYTYGLTGVDQPSNYLFVHILLATALVPVVLALCSRIYVGIRNDRRQVSVVGSFRTQDFWRRNRSSCSISVKRYLLYAPTRTKRLEPRTRVSNIANVGLNTSYLQLVIILAYVASNVTYCFALPRQSRAQMFAAFRGRCGTLAVYNLILAILFALRNNPLIWLLHLSYDTFNLFHRWTARLVVLESVAHVFAFIFNAYLAKYEGQGGWRSVTRMLQESVSYQWGLTAFIAFFFLVLHSISALRHAFYETFLNLHRIAVVVAISGIYFHLAKHALPQLPWVYVIIATLSFEPLARVIRVLLLNSSWKQRTWTQVSIEALPGDATRVTFTLPQSCNVKPGSHVHMYLPRLALWSSHPFSVAWTQPVDSTSTTPQKLPRYISDLTTTTIPSPTSLSCIIRARTGMTRSLHTLASSHDSKTTQIWGAIEGPYGGYHSFDSYGTVILFAAGVGITHHLLFLHHLLREHKAGMAATQKILLVWCISDIDAVDWVQPWLEELAGMPSFAHVVRVQIYFSRMSAEEFSGRCLPECLDVRLQRCDVQDVLDGEILAQVGAMAVSVCGPSGFNGGVRAAVRARVAVSCVDLFEEAFSY